MGDRLSKLLGAIARHVNVVHTRRGGNKRVPFDPESVLKHLNATHQVELDIVEGATLALEESNACLSVHNERRDAGDVLDNPHNEHSPAFQPFQFPIHFCRARIAAILFEGSGGHWKVCSLGRSVGEGEFRTAVGLAAAEEPEAAAVAAVGLAEACWERRENPTWGAGWCCARQSFVVEAVSS